MRSDADGNRLDKTSAPVTRPTASCYGASVSDLQLLGVAPGQRTRKQLGELQALKYLERTSASLLYRFKQDFRALAGVAHENLVALGELVVLPDSLTFFTGRPAAQPRARSARSSRGAQAWDRRAPTGRG